MNLTAAATLMVCRSALAKSPAVSRAAFAKHRESIDPELAKTLETVGSYTNEVAFTLPPPPLAFQCIPPRAFLKLDFAGIGIVCFLLSMHSMGAPRSTWQ